jgi:serine/threonine protein kinase
MESYQIGSLLGKGQFSKVYQATHTSSQTQVALKLVPKDSVRKREVTTHRNLVHVNIVRLF